jgi:hypothetical protein
MMKNAIGFSAAVLTLGFGSFAAAATFDGKHNLLCTTTEIYECDAALACRVLQHADAHDIRHMNVDFKKKRINLDHINSDHVSQIDRVEVVDGKLVLQGIEDGNEAEVDGGGWTISIDDRYGNMVFTLAGEGVAFVGMGGCVSAN